MDDFKRLKNWIMSYPPEAPFVSKSPHRCLELAHDTFTAATGATVELGLFADTLWNYGFKSEQVGRMPAGDGTDRTIGRWLIRLPSKPPGDTRVHQNARLRSVIG